MPGELCGEGEIYECSEAESNFYGLACHNSKARPRRITRLSTNSVPIEFLRPNPEEYTQ